ncbi:hypothetical protein V6N12_051692 [Hibiscus sabdariffa]|uniref:Uncharacterized protein n=1 Tax=Hibiscus sabdariffa TaxID=183260 RepID=A0ABR2GG20_9ROSI
MKKAIVSIKISYGTKWMMTLRSFIRKTHILYVQRVGDYLWSNLECLAHEIGFHNNYLLLGPIKDASSIRVEDENKVVVVACGKPQIWQKLTFPKLPKVTKVESIRSEEGQLRPTLTTNLVMLKLLEMFQSIRIVALIETFTIDDGEICFVTIGVRRASLVGASTLFRSTHDKT